MPGVTIERMKEGDSQIRNRALAHAFSYMNLIEGWGTGIPRLYREMKEYGLAEPEFIDMEIALRTNLYRAVGAAQNSDERVPGKTKKSAGESLKVPDKAEKSAGESLKVPDKAEKSAGESLKVPDNVRKNAMFENISKVSENTGVYRISSEACHAGGGQLPKQQAIIYQEILNNGQITSAKVEVLLGVRERRARVILKNMTESGIIRKVGAAQATKYVLNRR